MPAAIGNIRLDINGEPYFDKLPASNMAHPAFQNITIDEVGETYNVLFSTDERQMVNGINHLYGTTFNWGDLKGKSVEFFNPTKTNPITRLKFAKVGAYYTAKIVTDDSLDLEPAKEIKDIADVLTGQAQPEKDVVYYGDKEDKEKLRRFIQNCFKTHEMSTEPASGIDFTLMALGDDEFLTPVVLHNYVNDGGGYNTLLFKNEVLPAIELKLRQYSQEAVLNALSTKIGVKLTKDNVVSPNVIHAFEPFDGIDEVYTIHTLKRGDDVKYMATIEASSNATPDPVPDGDAG